MIMALVGASIGGCLLGRASTSCNSVIDLGSTVTGKSRPVEKAWRKILLIVLRHHTIIRAIIDIQLATGRALLV